MEQAPFELRTERHKFLFEAIGDLLPTDDLAHDVLHVGRVYVWALKLAPEAGADIDLAGAAALVHDLVNVPKEAPERSSASDLSADAATRHLIDAGYSTDEVAEITEAVRTTSWSKGLAPTNSLGAVLQDADRLDAIGAIGIARTLTTAQSIQGRTSALKLYDVQDPLAERRPPDDQVFAIDHFFVKLLELAEGMHLPAAKREAERRHEIVIAFLGELSREARGAFF